MPLDKLVLILVCVIAAAGLTVWLAALVSASMAFPWGWWLLVPTALVVYLVARVTMERLRSRDDVRTDRTRR